jgi:hypothetical protein
MRPRFANGSIEHRTDLLRIASDGASNTGHIFMKDRHDKPQNCWARVGAER